MYTRLCIRADVVANGLVAVKTTRTVCHDIVLEELISTEKSQS